jgi:hypothetical protein
MARKYIPKDPEALAEARRRNVRARWARLSAEERKQATRPAIDARLDNQRQRRENAA